MSFPWHHLRCSADERKGAFWHASRRSDPKANFQILLCNYLGINISTVIESRAQHLFWLKARQFLSPAHLAEKKAWKRQGWSYCARYLDKGFRSYCKHNFILKILLDRMPGAVASIRKEGGASRRLFGFSSRGHSLVAHSIWQLRAVTQSYWEGGGRSSVGPALPVIYCLWQFILLSVRLLFLLSLRPPPRSPHCCLWHWFTTKHITKPKPAESTFQLCWGSCDIHPPK